MNLTASDRSALIRLAADQPVGSPLRRTLAKMAARGVSTGALAKGVQNLANTLERTGWTTQVDVNQTGGSSSVFGPSSVELSIEKEYLDEDGDTETHYWWMTFLANGYGNLRDPEIGGAGWKVMKVEALRRLREDVQRINGLDL